MQLNLKYMFEDRQPDVIITYQHALCLGGICFESRLGPTTLHICCFVRHCEMGCLDEH